MDLFDLAVYILPCKVPAEAEACRNFVRIVQARTPVRLAKTTVAKS
jgi:hypothetical protein